VVQLQEDPDALGVHALHHLLPAGDLLVVVHAGRAQVAVAVGGGDGRLGEQEAAFGSALRVVFGQQRAGDGAGFGAHAGQRRQHHAAEAVPHDYVAALPCFPCRISSN
jgi:hypothetical protein